jgi:hypothetical protein
LKQNLTEEELEKQKLMEEYKEELVKVNIDAILLFVRLLVIKYVFN